MSDDGVSWTAALAALCRVVPGAEVVGERISTKRLEQLIFEREPGITWVPVAAHGGDDLEVFEEIAARLGDLDPASFAVILGDRSYHADCSPFGMTVHEIREFVDSFHERFEDELFSGDVLLLFEDRCIFVHHEGVCAALHARPSAGT